MNKKLAISLLVAACISSQLFAQQNSTRVRSSKSSPQKEMLSDTVRIKTVSKELIQELPADKDAVIKIVNTTRNLDIRPWAENKVKIVTNVSVKEKTAATITSEELMEAGGILFKSFGNRIDIQTRSSFAAEALLHNLSGTIKKSHAQSVYASPEELMYPSIAKIKNDGVHEEEYWNTTGGNTKSMTIFVPEGCRLDIDNKNTGVVINADILDARIKLNRSNLDARNFKKLYIMADYYTINISDVDEAELELESGSFTAGVIRSLDLDSKGSEVDYEGGNQLYLRSQNDRITLDEVDKVGGRKLYGDLRIGKLNTDLDIEGTNADIKIRNIAATVEKIKINDRYADLRIPVKNLTNFNVFFKGENSTVFTPFEKMVTLDLKLTEFDPAGKKDELKGKAKPETTSQKELDLERKALASIPVEDRGEYLISLAKAENKLRSAIPLGEKAPSQFKGSGGDITGKHTRFEITCNQCSVDFK